MMFVHVGLCGQLTFSIVYCRLRNSDMKKTNKQIEVVKLEELQGGAYVHVCILR